MTVTEYSKVLDSATLNFEGNNITNCCKNLLKGILEKNVNKRFSFDHAMSHPWVVLIKEKVEDITSKYQNDSEKMICQLNNTVITDDYFNNKNYFDIDIEKEEEIYKNWKKETKNSNNNSYSKFVGKKRERGKRTASTSQKGKEKLVTAK